MNSTGLGIFLEWKRNFISRGLVLVAIGLQLLPEHGIVHAAVGGAHKADYLLLKAVLHPRELSAKVRYRSAGCLEPGTDPAQQFPRTDAWAIDQR